MEDPLEDRDDRHRGQQVDRRLDRFQVPEDQPGAQDHDPHGAVGDADLALDAQRLGARPRVGDHQRGEHGEDDHAGGDIGMGDEEHGGVLDEPHGHRGEHDALLDPVQRRVQERTERRPLARHARIAAVERVAHRADDERDPAGDPPALQHEDGGDDTEPEAGQRDRVRREPRLDETVADLRLVVARGHDARRAYPARAGAGSAPSGSQAHACGRTRASRVCAASAETAAASPPVAASKIQWLAVTTTTMVTTGAYTAHSAFAHPWRAIRTIGTASISANATCIDRTAAYGLNNAFTDASEETPVKSATESTKPRPGSIRGGAAGKTT